MPLLVAALVAAVLVSGACCVWAAYRETPDARRRALVLGLVAAMAVATLLRLVVVPPHHAMYLDEPWYGEAACNLARNGDLGLCERTWDGVTCTPYEKAPGWPVLIAGWTLLFGCDAASAIDLNRIAGVLTVVLVGLAAACIGAAWWQSSFAAALAALMPLHASWSATGETNVAAAAILLAGLCGALDYVRSGRPCATALAAAGLALATALRPELLVPSAAVAAAMWSGAGRRRHRTARAALILAACAAAAAAGWPLWQMNAEISGGAFLSPGNVVANLRALLGPPALRVYGPLGLLALIGAAVLIVRRQAAVWLPLAAAIAAALAVLAYDRFHQRMLLAGVVTLLPLTAFAVPSGGATRAGARRGVLSAAALLVAVALAWLPEMIAIATPPETQLLETRLAARIATVDLPENGLLIAPHPTVVHAAGGPIALPASAAAGDAARLDAAVASGAPVYVLCDMFCEVDFPSGGEAAWCGDVFARFAVRPLIEERLHDRTYGVYQLIGPARGEPPPPCPRR